MAPVPRPCWAGAGGPDEVHTLMVIGHNPGIEELTRLLGKPDDGLAVAGKFPTGAAADLEFAVDGWSDVAPHGGRLRTWVRPRALS